MRLLFSSALLFCCTLMSAQNLVPNPSFETYTGCPAGNSAISNGFVANWNRPPGSIITPDLFTPCTTSGSSCTDFNTANNCVGSSVPFHGSAYAGFLWYYTGCPNCKEYIVAQLTSTLTGGTVYRASYRTKLGPLCRYGTNRHGLYISATAPNQPGGNQPILVTPTVERAGQVLDKVNWTVVSGTFTSAGTENYFTIGNFYNDASTSIFNFGSSAGSCIFATGAAYYYIDSVFLRPAVILPAEVVDFTGKETQWGNQLNWNVETSTELSEVWIEHSNDGEHFNTLASYRDSEWLSPQQFLHENFKQGLNYYRVGYQDLNGDFNVSNTVMIWNHTTPVLTQMTLSPNPANEWVFIQAEFADAPQGRLELSIADGEGKVCYLREVENAEAIFNAEVDVSQLAPGVYFLTLQSGNTLAREKLVVIR